MSMYIYGTFAVGILITVHMAINSMAGISVGDPRISNAVFWLTGSVTAIATVIAGGSGIGIFKKVAGVPPWLWIGGVIGAGIAVYASFVIPKIGVANLTLLFVVGQLLASAVLAHFGLLGSPKDPLTAWKLGGLCLVCAGTLLYFYVPRQAGM